MSKLLVILLSSLAVASSAEGPVDIMQVDKNFRQATVGNTPVKYADARKAPFVLQGFAFRQDSSEPFYRVPKSLTKNEVSTGLLWLARHTTGGAVLFRTDSPYLALQSDPVTGAATPDMAAISVSGYDLYERIPGQFPRFIKNIRTVEGGALQANIGDGKTMRDFILFMPLYSSVNTLEIGVAPTARFEAPTPQALKPILFYGSSITQGGCSSRPGNNYTTMICNTLDAPQINLGFSGNARGERAMAEAIASLDLSLFVYDYDHNAPTEEHLEATHEPFFQIIRKAHPELPILILSRPDARGPIKRMEICRATYEHAVAAGDKNVYFIAGHTLFGEAGMDFCTVDGVHPNDIGFYMMYKTCMPVVKKALKLE